MPVFPLSERNFTVDSSKTFIPFDSAKDRLCDRKNSLLVAVRPFLIQTKNDIILLDTGLGLLQENVPMIEKNLNAVGFSSDKITKVLLSHLHFDHANGMINSRTSKPQFTNAEYFIQKGEWEVAFQRQGLSYKTEILKAMKNSGQIHFLEDSGKITDEIEYELNGGHTPFHQSFIISDGEKNYFFGGDILASESQMNRKYIAKHDYEGKKVLEIRNQMLNMAAEETHVVLLYHSVRFFRIKVIKTPKDFIFEKDI